MRPQLTGSFYYGHPLGTISTLWSPLEPLRVPHFLYLCQMNCHLNETCNFSLLALNQLIPLIRVVIIAASESSVLVFAWLYQCLPAFAIFFYFALYYLSMLILACFWSLLHMFDHFCPCLPVLPIFVCLWPFVPLFYSPTFIKNEFTKFNWQIFITDDTYQSPNFETVGTTFKIIPAACKGVGKCGGEVDYWGEKVLYIFYLLFDTTILPSTLSPIKLQSAVAILLIIVLKCIDSVNLEA